MSETLNAEQIQHRLEELASSKIYAPATTVEALQALEIDRIADALERLISLLESQQVVIHTR